MTLRRGANQVQQGDDGSELHARVRSRLGQIVRGKYCLTRVIGVGGMAAVYAAQHRNGKEFAVKMLHPELSINSEVRTRFLREGYLANKVKHRGAVSAIDDDVADDGAAFLVMELLLGESVEASAEASGNRLPLDVITAVALQALEVLDAAHRQGVVHRDIKPANLFLTTEGEVKVLDFGIARLRDAAQSHATQTGMSLGTPAFMAPEQARGKMSEVDGRTDVWALGATMFALATGEIVHVAETSQEVMIRAATTPARSLGAILAVTPDAEGSVVAVIDKALAFAREGRWESAGAMRVALEAAARQAFGVVPGPDLLRALIAPRVRPSYSPPSAAPGTPAFAEAATLQESTNPKHDPAWPSGAGVGMTTAQPVSSSRDVPTLPLQRVPSRRGLVWAGVATLGVLGLGAGAFYFAFGPEPAAPPAGAATTMSSASVGAASSSASASTAPSASAPAPTVPSVAASALPLAAPPPPARPSSAPKTPAPHTASPSGKPSCDPPYVVDPMSGRKHFKEECF